MLARVERRFGLRKEGVVVRSAASANSRRSESISWSSAGVSSGFVVCLLESVFIGLEKKSSGLKFARDAGVELPASAFEPLAEGGSADA